MSGDDEPRLTEIPGKPPNPLELGVAGWNILHSSAAVYPYKPSPVQQQAMKNFIESWAHVYACSWCAYHMRDYVQKHPPSVQDKLTASRYVCELHNEVNERLGKDLFDCSPDVVLKRWHPGYPNKMEDKPTIEEQLAAAAKKKAEAAEAQRRQHKAEERRFSDFGLPAHGAAPREAAGWRSADAAAAAEKKASENKGSGKGWWFFGKSAFGGGDGGESSKPEPAAAAAAPPPPVHSTVWAGSNDNAATHPSPSAAVTPAVKYGAESLSQTPSRTKAADDETDVDAVLERLKRCQVYCPEDEALQKH